MTHKVSGLDYEEDLALPMPKPHRSRGNSPEADAIFEDYQTPLENPPSLNEFPSREVSPSCESTTSTIPESKKRTKFQILKSKMSFKDLKKELPSDEVSDPIPVPVLGENTKPCLRRPLNSATNTPSIASTACTTKVRPTLNQIALTRKVSVSTKSTSSVNASATPSRIPLPPSITLSQGGVPLKTDGSQRRTSGRRPPSYSSNASQEEKVVTDSSLGTASPDTRESHQLDIVVISPSPEGASNTLSVPPYLGRPKYPVTGESPPHPDDLLEGSGKVKYIPRTWLDGPCPPTPSSLNGKDSVESTSTAKQYRSSSIPSRVPTLKERFEKASLPLEESANGPRRPMGLQVDEIVEMVRSIQRHADTGIEGMTKKLEELSTWITDQLNHHIQNITDLSRANSDLFNKQSQLSREMMSFQLAIRLEIGGMERHLNGFEMQLVDELQAEVQALAKSYEQLNIKTDALLQDPSKDEAKHFMEVQRMKNTEIEAEIAYLKGHAPHDSALLPPLTLPIMPDMSVLSTRSIEPLIKNIESTVKIAEEQARLKDIATNAGVLAIAATHPPMLPPPRPPMKVSTSGVKRLSPTNTDEGETKNRELCVSEDKPAGDLPRSTSLTKKGFLKNIMTSSPDQKESAHQKTGHGISDEPKKWSIFGFRRRHATPNGNIPGVDTNARSLSSLKPTKEQARSDNQKDKSSTGSSIPPRPSVPVQFAYETPKKDSISWKPLHPALRSAEPRRSSSLKRPKAARPRPPPVDLSSPLHRGRGLSPLSPAVEGYSTACSSAGSSALPTATSLLPPYSTVHGGKSSSSLPPIAQMCPLTPTTSSSADGVPLPSSDAEPTLVSVSETDTKASESDDNAEEQPLLAGDDTGTEWSYVSKTETRSHETTI
jgi:hypothetical protein